MNTELIAVAKQLAQKFHRGQKYGENGYFSHHLWVVANKVAKAGGSDIEISAAYLHDILEDTVITVDDLYSTFYSKNIDGVDIFCLVDIVKSITKNKNEKYGEYIARLKCNGFAAKVKYYDSEANMEACIAQGDYERAKKYLKNLCELKDFA